jgi:hypothetical protein
MPVEDFSTKAGAFRRLAPGSGAAVGAAISKELTRRELDVVSLGAGSLEAAASEAHSRACVTVLRATITSWEDNDWFFSKKGDAIEVSVELFDAADLGLLATATVRKDAPYLAWLERRNPDRFTDEVVRQAVSKILGPRSRTQ